ncbi:DUF4404 family protein [Bremerella cremea]|uniref:DUF4404 family protein n=1 Tax=Bremerella cremea TaxID=1031537 RepID=A0A368KJT6_9BACT|nr:DUF4404 family protein [Bremerella cremea]RCS41028.1 DUF4404 family protein [Bremerella cremea]
MEDKLSELRQTLQELQKELRDVDHLDADTRVRLEGVMESINDALHREDTAALAHPSLRETLEERSSQLEDTSYPSLTRVLNNLADILGNSGL